MSSDSKPLYIGDRVRVVASGLVGTISRYGKNTTRWFVDFEGGSYGWYWPSDLTRTTDPLTPAPAKRPVPRRRWEVSTAYEYELDDLCADGWKPYAVTFEPSEMHSRAAGSFIRLYHLHRRVEVPDAP